MARQNSTPEQWRREKEALESALRHKEKELYSIQRIGKALSSTLQLDELLTLIMQEITSLMNADRSTLYIVDHERGEIWSKIAQKAEVKEIRLPLGKGISGYVAQTGETINIPDAYQDERFDPSVDRKTGYRTRSILCMPIWSPISEGDRREIIGVIQVLNKKNGAFTAEDESLLEAIAGEVAISIANARLYHRLERKLEEIDLLYEFEQMLSTVFDLREVYARMLRKTVDHLQAGWVLAFLPQESNYLFLGADARGNTYFESARSVSLGIIHFAEQPGREELIRLWPELQQYFRITADVDFGDVPILYTAVEGEEGQQGLLLAVDVREGRMLHYEDERKILDLIAQKLARARELHQLRENLLKQERLSAIGQMMSTIVHDLRSPINTVYGFVDLLEDAQATPEERAEYGQIIREEIKSIMTMITEILDFAKGKTSILPRKISVRDILKRFQPRLEQMCQRSGTELVLDIQDESPLLHADAEKLGRVFYNITKNALEAMGEGGRFHFRVFREDGQVVFQFTDNGPGIPRELQDRLFESFVSGKESGTGLGLAIVKKIVEEHHGEVELESREGQGATFRIRLPVHES